MLFSRAVDRRVSSNKNNERNVIAYQLFVSLNDGANSNTAFTGQTDPTKCFFGKWYYAYKIDDAGLNKILNELEPAHDALHASAEGINSASGRAAKVGLFNGSVVPIKRQIETIFSKIYEYIGPNQSDDSCYTKLPR